MSQRTVLVVATLAAAATLALLLREPPTDVAAPAPGGAEPVEASRPTVVLEQPSPRAPLEPTATIAAEEEDAALLTTDLVGRAVARSGVPLAGARVTFGWPPDTGWDAPLAAPEDWRARRETRAAEDGAFALLRLTSSAGIALVEVAEEGYCAARVRIASLATGAVIDLGDVVLDQPGAVRGRVVDEHGAPLAGARVQWSESDEFFLPAERSGRPGASSATDGTFEIAGLPPGAVHLCALAADRVALWSPPVPVATGRTTEVDPR